MFTSHRISSRHFLNPLSRSLLALFLFCFLLVNKKKEATKYNFFMVKFYEDDFPHRFQRVTQENIEAVRIDIMNNPSPNTRKK
jgi:hypothetical protein